MNETRANASAFVFKSKLYVFGGNVGRGERTRLVEFFSEQKRAWFTMKYEMPQALEGVHLIRKKQNVFLILGGRNAEGPN